MKTRAGLLMMCCIIYTGITFLLINHTIDGFLLSESKKREDLRLEWLKNEISRYSISEDDIMLNNSLENLIKHPEVLKITISQQGRIIADSDPADINSKSLFIQQLTPEEGKNNILFRQEDYRFGGKEYKLTLKINNILSKALMDSLMINLGVSFLIFLLLTLFIISRGKDKPNINASPLIRKESFFFFKEEDLLISNSAIVLILSGDNQVLKASKKAFETFGYDIKGKYITELMSLSIIKEYFSEGKKPLTANGKKYFIL